MTKGGRGLALAAWCAFVFAAACAGDHPAPPATTDAAPSPGERAGGLRFASERVVLTVEVGGRRVQVEGAYRFQNPGPGDRTVQIGYPIAVSAEQPPPATVELDDGSSRPVRCPAPDRCLATFPVHVVAGAVTEVRVRYAQELRASRAVYMLTSARRWGEPLAAADLEVRVPEALTGAQVTPAPDAVEPDGGLLVHVIRRRGFVPDEELVVTWTPPVR